MSYANTSQTELSRICEHPFVRIIISYVLVNISNEPVTYNRFYRVGGVTRISGFLLAMFTVLLLVVGTAPIGYIRRSTSMLYHKLFHNRSVVAIILVGALIFVLGIDLAKEALWDNRQRVNWMEFITIVSIMICMTLWDFVVGVVFGIIICCKLHTYFSVSECELTIRRPVLCCAKFSASKYPSYVFGRICCISCASSGFSPRIYPSSR